MFSPLSSLRGLCFAGLKTRPKDSNHLPALAQNIQTLDSLSGSEPEKLEKDIFRAIFPDLAPRHEGGCDHLVDDEFKANAGLLASNANMVLQQIITSCAADQAIFRFGKMNPDAAFRADGSLNKVAFFEYCDRQGVPGVRSNMPDRYLDNIRLHPGREMIRLNNGDYQVGFAGWRKSVSVSDASVTAPISLAQNETGPAEEPIYTRTLTLTKTIHRFCIGPMNKDDLAKIRTMHGLNAGTSTGWKQTLWTSSSANARLKTSHPEAHSRLAGQLELLEKEGVEIGDTDLLIKDFRPITAQGLGHALEKHLDLLNAPGFRLGAKYQHKKTQ